MKTIHYEDPFGKGSYTAALGEKGAMPTISINAETLPGAWELAVISCWEHGTRRKTHYDSTDGTPESKEATMTIRIENPFNEPRLHKNFPGGPEELESYRQEVIDGIHDHWMDPTVKSKWKYTYHERLFNYNPSIDLSAKDRGLLLSKGVNQIDKIIEDLAYHDITSRGAQATTWMPTADPLLEHDRPCLQRLWFRTLEDKDGGLVLNLNSHWRSRDLYKAWPMNCWAITDLQKIVANRLSEEIKQPVKVGSCIDISDSLHIYGDYFEEADAEIEKMKNTPLEVEEDPNAYFQKTRVWNSNEPRVVAMFEEAKKKLAQDPDWYAKGKG